jgi:hypothetical protein
MALTLDERVEIMLLSFRQGWAQRQVADEFNARHRERNPITHTAVWKLVNKFKGTNTVKVLIKCIECRGEHIEHIEGIAIPVTGREGS